MLTANCKANINCKNKQKNARNKVRGGEMIYATQSYWTSIVLILIIEKLILAKGHG